GRTCQAPGAASADLLSSDANTFRLSGATSASLPLVCPFDAQIQSVSAIAFPFALATGSNATVVYEVGINAAVRRNEKVTLVLTLRDASHPLLSGGSVRTPPAQLC